MDSVATYKRSVAGRCPRLYGVILFALVLAAGIRPLAAQQASATIAKNKTEFLIGDWVPVDLRVSVPFGARVYFPELKDSITDAIEVATVTAMDTTKRAGEYEYHQLANLIVFDTGNVLLPGFQFIVQRGNALDTLYTEPRMIHVSGVKIDTAGDIKPIKEPLKVPLTWREVLPYVLAALAAGLVVAAILWWRKRRRKKNQPVDPRYLLPPHVWALQELDRLDKEKLWQQGFVKEFYVRLSDIARSYIELRYQVPAMESTTEELMRTLHKGLLKQSYKQPLNELLVLSDFVKFAKAQPDLRENEASLHALRNFIELTRPKEVAPDTKPESTTPS